MNTNGFDIQFGKLKKYKGNDAKVLIPEYVECIDEYAFAGCRNIKEVFIPDNVLKIGRGAFSDCSELELVSLPLNLETIECDLFKNCIKLREIHIPDSVKVIGPSAFEGCKFLDFVSVPRDVRRIGEGAFYKCSSLADDYGFIIVEGILFGYEGTETEITIPVSVHKISSNAFEGSSIKKVSIPNHVSSIGICSFADCGDLEEIDLPSMTLIPFAAFSNCSSLEHFSVPYGVKTIEDAAFFGCKHLQSVFVSETTTEIKPAFIGCDSLCSIFIPRSVTKIDRTAFEFCPKVVIKGEADSYAEDYANEHGLPFEDKDHIDYFNHVPHWLNET